MGKTKFLVWFREVDREDVALVGGKGANLGEMIKAGFPVPGGFIITAASYYYLLEENKLTPKIKALLAKINYQSSESLEKNSKLIQKEILQAQVPKILTSGIFRYYKTLGGVLKDALVAVRSSATAEDLPKYSFAGQQETFLNVRGEANLIQAIRAAWASLFTARAIFYRHENKFDSLRIGIAVVVQKMIESEISGVMFTVNPVTNDKNKIVIEAVYGLGELIVQGTVSPDHYEVNKKTLGITTINVVPQQIQLIKKGSVNKKVKINKTLASKQKLVEKTIVELAKIGREIEKHYYFPQDIEWAIEKNKIYIVQTRPVTTIVESGKLKVEKERSQKFSTLNSQLSIILRGDPASPGIATGPVRIVRSAKEIDKVKTGDILVAPKTSPDYVMAMKRAAGIITDTGGRTSHAAIVSRELGIPAVVGCKVATKILKNGMLITLNGQTGEIFRGAPQKTTKTASLIGKRLQTATKLFVNLSEPAMAEKIATMDVDGVGLLRAEFMLAQIGTHPKKLFEEKKGKKLINHLVDGLRIISESFYPRPVVYRSSDFKTNEYKNLAGGKIFEPNEENPMLGFRGAYRYLSDPKIFQLELEAIKIVREELNLNNLWLMIPYVRTVQEFTAVKKIISETGLLRHPSFKLWLMIEIPSNVILIEDFLSSGVDGISIGSNDLTMLLLGVDRDNSEVKTEFNELDKAVLWAMERVIKAASRFKVTSSICGQAPSDHPEIAEKLIEWGITSISVTPDMTAQMRENIAEIEKRIIKRRSTRVYG